MRKKRSFLAVMGLLVGTMSFAGGTAAYLSKSAGEVKNVFTAGSVKAQLTEAHWDTQKASKVYPGQSLEKDPVVKNIGENSANVFLEVNVPMRSIAVLDGSTGRKTIRENRELFTFQADETKWALLYQEKTAGNKKYIYGYKSVLNPGESTTPLFRKIAAVSYLEGELDASVSYDVPVIASVIQEQDGSKTMKEIYQEYLKQADIDQKEARE